jgi:hypothetical protein
MQLCEVARAQVTIVFPMLLSASNMRHDVVIFCPRGLKYRVLAQGSPLPPQCCWVEFPKEDANLFRTTGTPQNL